VDPWSVIGQVPLLANATQVELEHLEGGLTNVNYLVIADDQRFVLRIAGPNSDVLGIDRTLEADCLSLAEASGIGPQVIATSPDGHLVTRFLEGSSPFTPEEFKKSETVARVARRLVDVHSLGPVHGRFDPAGDIQRWTQHSTHRQYLKDQRFVRLQEHTIGVLSSDSGPGRQVMLCHNDPYYLNFLDDGELRLIDWEYAGMGDPLYDLAAVGYALDNDGRDLLLSSYGGDLPGFSREALDEMIGVFLCWNAAWTLVQMDVAEIEFDYPEFLEQLLTQAKTEGLV
jgi:thiamine kinase-like enzyme